MDKSTLANVRRYGFETDLSVALILKFATVWALAITYVPRTQNT